MLAPSLLALALLTAPLAAPASAEAPEAGLREQQWSLESARRHFEARRFEQAHAEFEAAAREGSAPLPAGALRGIIGAGILTAVAISLSRLV